MFNRARACFSGLRSFQKKNPSGLSCMSFWWTLCYNGFNCYALCPSSPLPPNLIYLHFNWELIPSPWKFLSESLVFFFFMIKLVILLDIGEPCFHCSLMYLIRCVYQFCCNVKDGTPLKFSYIRKAKKKWKTVKICFKDSISFLSSISLGEVVVSSSSSWLLSLCFGFSCSVQMKLAKIFFNFFLST